MRNKIYKKIMVIEAVFFLLLLSLFAPFVQSHTILSDDRQILSLMYSIPEPVVTNYTVHKNHFDRIEIPGLPLSDQVGKPIIPVKPIHVLLPQFSSIDSITVEYDEKILVGKNFNIENLQEYVPLEEQDHNEYDPYTYDENISLIKNRIWQIAKNHRIETIDELLYSMEQKSFNFDVTKPFPKDEFSLIGISGFRGYAIASLLLYPIHFLAETGEIYYSPTLTVHIKTEEDRESPIYSLYRNLADDESEVKRMVENPWSTTTYTPYDIKDTYHSSLVGPENNYDYVIITSEQLKYAAAPYSFYNLLNVKKAKGISATLVTVEEIKREPAYWNRTHPLFNNTATQIRHFITDAYHNWGMNYTLLGGDGDKDAVYQDCIIPAKQLYTQSEIIPSDVYYCCLDGTYNFDCDKLWGEQTDGPSGGEIDLIGDVYIGRAPVDSPEEMSNFVKKTIQYEYTSDPYLKKVLLVGENLRFYGEQRWGGNYKDQLIDGSTAHGYITQGIPSNVYTIETLYDRDRLLLGWPSSELINKIEGGIHIIDHLGHSSSEYNMKLTIDDVDSLSNERPCFIYSQGCSSGGFDNPEGYDCIAEHFIGSSPYGAFAGIWNTRSGWGDRTSIDCPAQRFDRLFWDEVFGNDIYQLSKAHQQSKFNAFSNNSEDRMRYTFYGLTYFGDPELRLKLPQYPKNDIAIASIESPLYVTPDELFTLRTTVTNYGNQTNNDIHVHYIINNELYDTYTISYLPKKQDQVIIFSLTLPFGTHMINISIPSSTNESCVFNNNMQRMVISGSDVIIKKVTIPSPPLYIDEPSKFRITLENHGSINQDQIQLNLQANDVIVDRVLVTLPRNSCVNTTLSWVPKHMQWYDLTIEITNTQHEPYPLFMSNRYTTMLHPVKHTVYVDDAQDADFTSIQEAIYWLGSHDTIKVGPGLYQENLIINKPLTIKGDSRKTCIIDGENCGDVIHISANFVTLSDFMIQNSGNTPYDDGIELYQSYGSTILNNIIKNCTCGVNLCFSQNMLIKGNIIQSNLINIELVYSRKNTISQNIIKGTETLLEINSSNLSGFYGVILYRSKNNVIKRNSITNNYLGICFLFQSNKNNIHHNNFHKKIIANALCIKCSQNRFYRNYWSRPRLLPKPIINNHGLIGYIPGITFDLRPRLLPNIITTEPNPIFSDKLHNIAQNNSGGKE